jgi:LysM repeat protein
MRDVPTTMNNQSPLIPQGSLLEQRNKGRARVKIAVFLVLAIHGIGLMALLMQGCKKEPEANTGTGAEATNAPDMSTNAGPAFVEPTNTPPASNVTAAASPTNPAPASPPIEPVQPPTAPAQSATDYVIVKGDTFSTVAKKFHVSLKALVDANPSVEPTKLKIGQSVHIPAPVMSASSGPTSHPALSDGAASGQTYTVKSGDSLTKISSQFGISIKSLRSANNLKTDKIVVGQKLTIPGKTSTTASSTPASTSGAPTSATGQ